MTTQTFRFADGRMLVRRVAWQELVALVTAVLLIAVLVAPVPPMARFGVGLAFTVWGPGVAVLALSGGRMFGRYHPGLVIGLGFAVEILAAEVLLWAHVFYPRTALIVLAVLVIAGLAYAARRDLAAGGPAGTARTGAGHAATAGAGMNLLTHDGVPAGDGEGAPPVPGSSGEGAPSAGVAPPVAAPPGVDPVVAVPPGPSPDAPPAVTGSPSGTGPTPTLDDGPASDLRDDAAPPASGNSDGSGDG